MADNKKDALRAAGKEIRRIAAPVLEKLDRDHAALIVESLQTFDQAAADEVEKRRATQKQIARVMRPILEQADREAAPSVAAALAEWDQLDAGDAKKEEV